MKKLESRKNFVKKERVADKETIHSLCVKGGWREEEWFSKSHFVELIYPLRGWDHMTCGFPGDNKGSSITKGLRTAKRGRN